MRSLCYYEEVINLHKISVRIFTSQNIQKQIKNQYKNDYVHRQEAARKGREHISMRSRTSKIRDGFHLIDTVQQQQANISILIADSEVFLVDEQETYNKNNMMGLISIKN